MAEIRYVDGEYRVDRQCVFQKSAGATSQTVEIPLLDRARRAYDWRQLLVGADGTLDQQDWTRLKSTLATHTDAETAAALGAQVDVLAVS